MCRVSSKKLVGINEFVIIGSCCLIITIEAFHELLFRATMMHWKMLLITQGVFF